MYDYQGLFNCLRPDPPMVSDIAELPEIAECDFCTNQATRSVDFKENGVKRHLYTCDECHFQEGQWNNRYIINVTRL